MNINMGFAEYNCEHDAVSLWAGFLFLSFSFFLFFLQVISDDNVV